MCYNFKVYADITRAMNRHNKTMSGVYFNTLDAILLNLVKSFDDSGNNFYMSNRELGEVLVADPSTIQRSIDRLLAAKLIAKRVTRQGVRPMRILTYCKKEVEKMIGELKNELDYES